MAGETVTGLAGGAVTALEDARAAFVAASASAQEVSLAYRRNPSDANWHAHREAAEREAEAWHAYDAMVKEARAMGARDVEWARK